MISRNDLRILARARLRDARVLFRGGRYDAAVYLCGYTVEIALKERICRTLRWPDFPETNAEFRGLESFRTHNLDLLLRLSGVEERIRSRLLPEWTIVAGWRPERRYGRVGLVSEVDARDMIQAVQLILRAL